MYTGKYLKFVILTIVSVFLLNTFICAQVEPKKPQTIPADTELEKESDEVLRVDVNLIQTAVSVFDKKGNFIENLKPEDFELKVDGKPVPISFFESQGAGNLNKPKINDKKESSPNVEKILSDAGRTIVFVVDDLHLSADSHKRAKDLLNNFIEKEMRDADSVAIISTTGKIGFLQQFTDDRIVLKEAVKRLNLTRSYSSADFQRPPMSEYEAFLINNRDFDTTEYFAELLVNEIKGKSLDSARAQVRSRAESIISEAEQISGETLTVLERAVRSKSENGGRKTVFFLSDGFLTNALGSSLSDRQNRIIDAAARNNAVIYSLDVKGLDAGMPDGTAGSGRNRALQYRIQAGERFDALGSMTLTAKSTGGRLITNTNDIKTEVSEVLNETGRYYLLAWEPIEEIIPNLKLRVVEVSIKGRAELEIRYQNGFLSKTPINKEKEKRARPTAAPTIDNELIARAKSSSTSNDLEIALSLNHFKPQKEGTNISGSAQFQVDEANSAGPNLNSKNIELLLIVYNADGKSQSVFRDKISVGNSKTADKSRGIYNFQTKLKPGLYQVRAAAKDSASGKFGSIAQWLFIPPDDSEQIALSSLLIGVKTNKKISENRSPIEGVELNYNRRFTPDTNLIYMAYVYNAKINGSTKAPEIWIKTELLSKGKIVFEVPSRRLQTDSQDFSDLFYGAELPLRGLSPGIYRLRFTAEDKTKKSAVSQTVPIKIEF